jgi:hypothetical protein
MFTVHGLTLTMVACAATPVEPLRALENGLITDCVRILFEEEMTPTQKWILDSLLWRLGNLPQQYYTSLDVKPFMLCLLRKDGITSLSELTAKYKVGIMFTIVTVSLQVNRKILLEEVLGSNARFNDVCQVFQMMLLAYWVWLRKETHWVCGDVLSCEGTCTAI